MVVVTDFTAGVTSVVPTALTVVPYEGLWVDQSRISDNTASAVYGRGSDIYVHSDVALRFRNTTHTEFDVASTVSACVLLIQRKTAQSSHMLAIVMQQLHLMRLVSGLNSTVTCFHNAVNTRSAYAPGSAQLPYGVYSTGGLCVPLWPELGTSPVLSQISAWHQSLVGNAFVYHASTANTHWAWERLVARA